MPKRPYELICKVYSVNANRHTGHGFDFGVPVPLSQAQRDQLELQCTARELCRI